MKWFKHISDSLDDPFIFDLIKQHGADGYLVFFGTLEVYAREFKTHRGWKLDVSTDFLRSKLGYKDEQKMFSVLKSISDEKKWDININENRISIRVPKFNQLADTYTARLSSKSVRTHDAHSTDNVTAYKEVEVDLEVDIDIEKNKTLEQAPKPSSKRFIKPTPQEIEAYARSVDLIVDGTAFCDWFESVGWVVGKNRPMKDWKASTRNWARRDSKTSPGRNISKGPDLLVQAKSELRHCDHLYESDHQRWMHLLRDHPEQKDELRRWMNERWPFNVEDDGDKDMVSSEDVKALMADLGESKRMPQIEEEE